MWSTDKQTQPKTVKCKGFLIAATEMAANLFTNIRRFASVLNLKFIEQTNYYKHRGSYIYSEFNEAWLRNQKEQYTEIAHVGNPIEIGVDGQFDSPGHCATYCTVTGMDVATDKIIKSK